MDRDAFAAASIAYLDDAEARFADAFRAAMRAASSPVLRRLAGARVIVAATAEPDPVFSVGDLGVIRGLWQVQVETMLVPLVADLYATGALGAIVSIGPRATVGLSAETVAAAVNDAVNRGAIDWLRGAQNRLVGIGNDAWEAARTELVDGYRAGESVPELTGRVRDALGVAEDRAETVARTEVISASNAGSYTAAQAYGDLGPKRKTWMATVDARTRPTHASADGQTVPMAADFTVGGAALAFPGDPSGPVREVANCRCTIVYDLPDDTIEGEGRQTGGVTASTEEPPMSRRTGLLTRSGYRVPPPPNRSRLAEGDTADEAAEEGTDTIQLDVVEGIILEPFSVIMAVEGRWTGDDRFILPGALRWDGVLPIPLTADHEDDVPSVVGLVGQVERIPWEDGANLIVGWGFLDLGTEERPNDAAYQVRDRYASGALRGVSIRVDDETLGGVDPATVADVDDEWWLYVVEDARIRALSPTPVAAFAEAALFLGPDDIDLNTIEGPPAPDNPAVALDHEAAEAAREVAEEAIEDAIDDIIGEDVIVLPASAYTVARVGNGPGFDLLTAAAPSTAAPPEWFGDPAFGPYDDDERLCWDPELDIEGCPLTIDDDGRVYGHIALWGTCHTGFPNQCITPPRSAAGYAHYRTGEYVCSDGSRVAVGRLTAGTGHAPSGADAYTALAHYDHTGTQVGYVAAGEDAYGIWVAGTVAPTATEEQLTVMRASPPSGDWRKIGSGLELLATLHVNAPGFPVPRVRIVEGRTEAMVAVGALHRDRMTRVRHRRTGGPGLDAAAQRIARSIGRDRQALVSALRQRVHPEQEAR